MSTSISYIAKLYNSSKHTEDISLWGLNKPHTGCIEDDFHKVQYAGSKVIRITTSEDDFLFDTMSYSIGEKEVKIPLALFCNPFARYKKFIDIPINFDARESRLKFRLKPDSTRGVMIYNEKSNLLCRDIYKDAVHDVQKNTVSPCIEQPTAFETPFKCIMVKNQTNRTKKVNIFDKQNEWYGDDLKSCDFIRIVSDNEKQFGEELFGDSFCESKKLFLQSYISPYQETCKILDVNYPIADTTSVIETYLMPWTNVMYILMDTKAKK